MAKAAKVAPAQLRALDRIGQVRASRDLYLVGGAALAYHLGHRTSTDLDLFSLKGRVDFEAFKRLASRDPGVRVVSATAVMLKMTFSRVPVDIVRYPYPPLDPPQPGPAGFRVAGLRDLAAMKLAAVARRGIRRDFWDVDELLNSGMELRDAMDFYRARFGRAESDLYHVIRSLTFFDDAENDRLWPKGLTPLHWTRIKRRMTQEARRVLRGMLK